MIKKLKIGNKKISKSMVLYGLVGTISLTSFINGCGNKDFFTYDQAAIEDNIRKAEEDCFGFIINGQENIKFCILESKSRARKEVYDLYTKDLIGIYADGSIYSVNDDRILYYKDQIFLFDEIIDVIDHNYKYVKHINLKPYVNERYSERKYTGYAVYEITDRVTLEKEIALCKKIGSNIYFNLEKNEIINNEYKDMEVLWGQVSQNTRYELMRFLNIVTEMKLVSEEHKELEKTKEKNAYESIVSIQSGGFLKELMINCGNLESLSEDFYDYLNDFISTHNYDYISIYKDTGILDYDKIHFKKGTSITFVNCDGNYCNDSEDKFEEAKYISISNSYTDKSKFSSDLVEGCKAKNITYISQYEKLKSLDILLEPETKDIYIRLWGEEAKKISIKSKDEIIKDLEIEIEINTLDNNTIIDLPQNVSKLTIHARKIQSATALEKLCDIPYICVEINQDIYSIGEIITNENSKGQKFIDDLNEFITEINTKDELNDRIIDLQEDLILKLDFSKVDKVPRGFYKRVNDLLVEYNIKEVCFINVLDSLDYSRIYLDDVELISFTVLKDDYSKTTTYRNEEGFEDFISEAGTLRENNSLTLNKK